MPTCASKPVAMLTIIHCAALCAWEAHGAYGLFCSDSQARRLYWPGLSKLSFFCVPESQLGKQLEIANFSSELRRGPCGHATDVMICEREGSGCKWAEVKRFDYCVCYGHQGVNLTATWGSQHCQDYYAISKNACSKESHAYANIKPTLLAAYSIFPNWVLWAACFWSLSLLLTLFVLLFAAKQRGTLEQAERFFILSALLYVIGLILNLCVIIIFAVHGFHIFMLFSVFLMLLPAMFSLVRPSPGTPILSLVCLPLEMLQIRILFDTVVRFQNIRLQGSESESDGCNQREMEDKRITLTFITGFIFRSGPSSLLQLYAALCCVSAKALDRQILQASMWVQLISLAFGFMQIDIWQQPTPLGTTTIIRKYLFRFSELTSRVFSLALFAFISRRQDAGIHEDAQHWVFVYVLGEFIFIAYVIKVLSPTDDITKVPLLILGVFMALVATPPRPLVEASHFVFKVQWYIPFRFVSYVILSCIASFVLKQWTDKCDFFYDHIHFIWILVCSMLALLGFSTCECCMIESGYSYLVEE